MASRVRADRVHLAKITLNCSLLIEEQVLPSHDAGQVDSLNIYSHFLSISTLITQVLILTGLMFARNVHRILLRSNVVTSRRSVTTLEGNPHIVRLAILQAITTNT